MELITTLDNLIVHNQLSNRSLWCNKLDASFIPASGEKLLEAWKPTCQGIVHGVVGKMQILPGSGWKLVLIAGHEFVGYIPRGVQVYRITRVAVLPLATDPTQEFCQLDSCEKHTNNGIEVQASNQKVQQTWNSIKSGASTISSKRNMFVKDMKDKDKLEKRLTEELCKMFSDSQSFYYSPNGDITNTQQRAYQLDQYSWKVTDDRFFWNKNMLEELINSSDPMASDWVLPIMQGFVQIQRCAIDHWEFLEEEEEDEEEEIEDFVDTTSIEKHRTGENLKEDEFDLIIVSRRSRHRAGTRYKRRGVDENGNVANFVETEQIVCVLTHIMSYVIIRGSVPVFWSQPGTKYRPLPLIDRSFEESRVSFAKHFDQDLKLYKKEVIVSLVELNGREKIIADNFMEHLFAYDCENLTFVTFDFHEYCRGMKFQNVSILTEALADMFDKMGFYWTDGTGNISSQQEVFRVNCMDCLDRTNVVEAAFARRMLKIILRKLGRLLPEENLSPSCLRTHNNIWANNGDVISIQYAGTAAMKGDFTRTGERKIAGVMKDGYNSANRYYLNRFKDTYRQTIIDMMLGNQLTEDLSVTTNGNAEEEEVWTAEKEENITSLVRHCELTLVPRDEECLGGWALVDPFSFVTDQPQDEDVILMLTHEAYYLARYDERLEEVFSYQRIPLSAVSKIEVGCESFHFKNQFVFMRIHYNYESNAGYFHTMRTIQKRSIAESKTILLSIAEVFLSVARYRGLSLRINETKFDRKRSKSQQHVYSLTSKRTMSTSSRSNANNVPKITVEEAEGDFVSVHNKMTPPPLLRTTQEESADTSIHKSHSDGELTSYDRKMTSRVENLFKRTKTAIQQNVGTKLRQISSPDENRTRLQRINDKLANRSEVVRNMLPEFKNKLQTAFSASPRVTRKLLSREEAERRERCKSRIIEL